MTNSEVATFQFIQDTGQAFHQAYHQIIQRRKQTPFSSEEQQFMHHRRGHMPNSIYCMIVAHLALNLVLMQTPS